jgi:predicted ATP-grasp superfamily ATP-dependent carboligase
MASRIRRSSAVNIFFHEFITSGALSGHPLPASLLREGDAMRRAILADLLAIETVKVVTTRDTRVDAFNHPRLTEFPISRCGSESSLFHSFCTECDGGLIVAPEIGDELQRRVAAAVESCASGRLWNSPSVIEPASDKWRTHLLFKEAGIPTIETCLGSVRNWHRWNRPIAKPRDGAGSQNIRSVSLNQKLSDRWIVQPFVRGRWLSCTIFFDLSGRRCAFPPAEQRIADDGSFTYLGGVMPAGCDVARVQSLAEQAIDALSDDHSDLIGPIGVDLVEDERTGDVLVCEVNPRFTTSYVAARELSETNLLAGLIAPDAAPPAWKQHCVEFDAGGRVSTSKSPAFRK